VEHARSKGPAIVEAMCYRFRGHYEGDLDLYRSQSEKSERTTKKDPLELTRTRLLEGVLTEETLLELEASATEEVAAILDRVRRDSQPDRSRAYDHVFVSGLDLSEGVRS